MSDIAVIFPGQGSQSLGMLSAYERHPVLLQAVEETADAIGRDIAALMEGGDEAALGKTENTQPIMLAVGVGVYRMVRERLPSPLFMAGHSLGEYSALVCAGALSLSAAARLVAYRAELMQNAVADGGMAAILGADAATVETVCETLRGDGESVWAANYNSDRQIVVAGFKNSVKRAADACKQAGAKRAVVLPMSVPSHCPLLQSAADALLLALEQVDWQSPTTSVLHAAAGGDNGDGGNGGVSLPRLMAAQLVRPVVWHDILRRMRDGGVRCVIECGPGKVLTNLGKKSGLTHVAADNAQAVAAL